jgi:DNA-directed RNA polymerase specialized sigma24 family protein
MQNGLANRKTERLTREGLDRLLLALGHNRDEAAARYERLRERLVFFFARRQFVLADSLADEALDRLASRLSTGEPIEVPESYAYGIARLVAQEEGRRCIREAEANRHYAGNISSVPDTQDEGEIQEAMEACLSRHTEADRKLLMEYYTSRGRALIDHRRRLAESLGMTPNAFRKRVFRLRRAIEGCVRTRLSQKNGTR